MRGNGDAAKDPRQLEREVNEQRRELNETIRALEDKFSSKEIYNYASNYVRDYGGEFAHNLGQSMKSNPLPVVLTSIGLLWMMAGQRNPDSSRSYAGRPYMGMGSSSGVGSSSDSGSRMQGMKERGADLKNNASSARDKASEKASQTAHDVRDKMGAAGHNLRERADHMRDRVSGARGNLSHSMGSARSNFDHYLREQPLALGALGIAVGAFIGAALPRTDAENRAMGDVSERAKQKASEMAEKGYEKASEVGKSVRDEAERSLDSQRNPEQQKTAASSKSQGSSPTA